MKEKTQASSYPLRIAPELRCWVQERADKNMRSLNSEITLLLVAVKGQVERKEAKQETA